MIKILWFSLTPCNSINRRKEKVIRAGWLMSLENKIKESPDIELSVAYFSDVDEPSYDYDGVRYFPMYRKAYSNPLARVVNRYRARKYNKDIKNMLGVIADFKPDVIHIHGTEECFGYVAKYVVDIPVIYSIQGLISSYTLKYFSGIPHSVTRSYSKLTEYIRRVSYLDYYKYFKDRSDRECEFLKNAKYVLGRTFWDRRICELFNPDVRYYVSNEILRPQFYKNEWKKDAFNKKLKIVTTSSDGLYKGFESILRTAALLKRFADFDFEWIVIGIEKNSKIVDLAEKYTKLQAENCHVVVAGMADADRVVDILLNADIYCQVSHIENSPNSLCEALMLGLPCVATYAGGTGSLMTNGEDGLLVQDGDPYVMAGSIVDMQKDVSRAKEYGAAARKRALKRHDMADIAAGLIGIYKNVLNL